jgi:ABC-type phosphate transport system substrate-binding protein
MMRRTNRIAVTVIGFALSLGVGVAEAEVVAVVSSSSPVTTLSKNQVADIFLGKTVRFPDGRRVVPIDQAEGTVARDEFYIQYTGKSAAQLKAHWSKIIFTGRGQPPRAVANSSEIKAQLAGNPNAIGYIERNSADDTVTVLLVQ